jgi:hypothetical protein
MRPLDVEPWHFNPSFPASPTQPTLQQIRRLDHITLLSLVHMLICDNKVSSSGTRMSRWNKAPQIRDPWFGLLALWRTLDLMEPPLTRYLVSLHSSVVSSQPIAIAPPAVGILVRVKFALGNRHLLVRYGGALLIFALLAIEAKRPGTLARSIIEDTRSSPT